jgi:DNA uptake protein ComE-like DNA-binding protein
LLRLPGVSPALAARIVAARPFADIDELRRVPGLRRGLLERLRPLVAPLP